MKSIIPRAVIAGTGSGSGKTTVSCAILQALVNRGLNACSFKCGPDYIDPMFHSEAIGARGTNLDSFFFDDNTLKLLLTENACGADVSIIEGVMGFYDGIGTDSGKASTFEVSQITDSPVVLVVDARGAARSILAVIHGFLTFAPENNICGVILNRCSASVYKMLENTITEQFSGRVMPLGFLPNTAECTIESRYLGLVTAEEIRDIKKRLNKLAEYAEKCIDIDKLLKIAEGAAPVCCNELNIPTYGERVRIGVARDKAFCFYYDDNLRLLERMGAELVSFSPLYDKALPDGLDGIYFGGGYPELYAEELSRNRSMLKSVKSAIEIKTPCIAECGGFMYLSKSIGEYPMADCIGGECSDKGKLVRFGYITLTAKQDNLLCRENEKIKAHEFHYWDSTESGGDFVAAKPNGKQWTCITATKSLFAGYPHLHFYADINFAVNFYEACIKEKHGND